MQPAIADLFISHLDIRMDREQQSWKQRPLPSQIVALVARVGHPVVAGRVVVKNKLTPHKAAFSQRVCRKRITVRSFVNRPSTAWAWSRFPGLTDQALETSLDIIAVWSHWTTLTGFGASPVRMRYTHVEPCLVVLCSSVCPWPIGDRIGGNRSPSAVRISDFIPIIPTFVATRVSYRAIVPHHGCVAHAVAGMGD